MSNPVAINLALLPKERDYNRLRVLAEKLDSPFWIWQENAVLHLTLWMAILDQHHVEVIEKKIRFKTIILKTRGCTLKKSSRSTANLVVLDFEHSDILFNTHVQTGKVFKPVELAVEPHNSMFYSPEVSALSMNYVKNFRSAYALNNFSPHITLGLTTNDKLSNEFNLIQDIEFDRAGIFSISDGCTCVAPFKIFQ